MKILIVSQFYFPERFSVTDIAESFVKAGHEVTVITGKPNYGYGEVVKGYEKVKYEEINNVKVHRVKLFPRKDSRISVIKNYLSFHNNGKRFVRHFNGDFDIVLAFSLSPVISVSPALHFAKKHKIPCVLYCMDLWPESTLVTGAVKKDSLMYKVLYKWSKSIYDRCDRIIISSPSFKDYFVNELGIKNKIFKVVNQPILNSTKNLEPIVYENKHNFVYAGNIGKIQLIDQLIDAMKFVKTKDVKLHLIGMGSELENVKNKIKNEKLINVVYEGAFPIERAEAYYANADALIVSLKNDGYVGRTISNKAVQYMKYAKPILAVVGGDSKILLENAKGAVFSGENAENIAEKIDDLCKMSKKEKDQLGLNNRKYFEENFSLEKLTQLLLEELIEAKK